MPLTIPPIVRRPTLVAATAPADAGRRRALGTLGLASVGAAALATASFAPRAAFAQSTPEEYVAMTAKAGAFTKTLAEAAMERGEADAIKTFAQLEIGEVDALMEVLAAAGAPATVELDPEQMQMIEQMQGMEGAEFDRMFLEAQLTGHQTALGIQEPMADMSEITLPVATAKLAEESIKSHIAMLEMIQAQMG